MKTDDNPTEKCLFGIKIVFYLNCFICLWVVFMSCRPGSIDMKHRWFCRKDQKLCFSLSLSLSLSLQLQFVIFVCLIFYLFWQNFSFLFRLKHSKSRFFSLIFLGVKHFSIVVFCFCLNFFYIFEDKTEKKKVKGYLRTKNLQESQKRFHFFWKPIIEDLKSKNLPTILVILWFLYFSLFFLLYFLFQIMCDNSSFFVIWRVLVSCYISDTELGLFSLSVTVSDTFFLVFYLWLLFYSLGLLLLQQFRFRLLAN